MPDQGWKDVQKLVTLGDEYKNLITDLEGNEKVWRNWFDYERPEQEELPAGYTKLSAFQTLLLLRIFRPDRVINGVKRFIIEHYNNNH